MKDVVFKLKHEEQVPGEWVAYSLHDTKGVLQYIGVCKLSQLCSIPDAKKHPRFYSVFDAIDEITVKIHELFQTKTDCVLYVNRFLINNPRPYMMQFFGAYRGSVGVECIETGEIFNTMTECARVHGLSAPNLSRHLSGDSNYRTVKGRTYRRIEKETTI